MRRFSVGLNTLTTLFIVVFSISSAQADDDRDFADRQISAKVAPIAELMQFPTPTLEFILPIREQVAQELAAVYRARREIPSTVVARDVRSAMEQSFKIEENLFAFFRQHVIDVRTRYYATPELVADDAKKLLAQKADELIVILASIQAKAPAAQHIGDANLPDAFLEDAQSLMGDLREAERLVQEISFQLSKVTETKELKGRFWMERTAFYFGKILIYPMALTEIVLRATPWVVVGAVPTIVGVGMQEWVDWAQREGVRSALEILSHEFHRHPYLYGGSGFILATVAYAAFQVALEVGNILQMLIGTSTVDGPSFNFMPRFTLAVDEFLDELPTRPHTLRVPVPGDRAGLAEMHDRLRTFLPPSAMNGRRTGSIPAQIQTFVANAILSLMRPCERGLLSAEELKARGYLNVKR